MQNLKINKVLFLAIIFLVGCVSSSYKIDRQDKGRTQLLVASDRVSLECYRLDDYEGDIKEPHLFSIYVLDEKNTVLTIGQGTMLGKEDCFRRIDKVTKIFAVHCCLE